MRRKITRIALFSLALALVGFLTWRMHIEIRLNKAEREVAAYGYPVTLDGWLERWEIPAGEANAADLYHEAFAVMKFEGLDLFEFNDTGKIVSGKVFWSGENITKVE